MLARYVEVARQTVKSALGQSYWTSAPRLSRKFEPGKLRYYYRDFTPKVAWAGPVDRRGLPLAEEVGGRSFLHPILLAQKALGHWNLWQDSQGSGRAEFEAFMHLARALMEIQEPAGGLPIECMRKMVYLRPFSAMAQGQAASVFVRAHAAARDEGFLVRAGRAIDFMLLPIDRGGTSRDLHGGLLLEEYPKRRPDGVLNGWIHAIFGLYDSTLADPRADRLSSLRCTVQTLADCLPRYDLGFWSKYDLDGTISSAYYHQEHIEQLKALALAFPCSAQLFLGWRSRFEEYLRSRGNRGRALLLKMAQKVVRPPATVLKAPSGFEQRTSLHAVDGPGG